jgi:nondiscriminating aspartyl-tRNA synthetase
LDIKVPGVPESIPSLRLPDAQQLIFERYGEDCRGEPDLAPQHEAWLCDYAEKELGSEFLFITHYPTSKRPFYTYPDDEDPSLTKGFDLLFRGCEIVTGGQRIHRHEQLLDNAVTWGIDPEAIDGYLQAFKFGMPPHGGCAIGLERLVMQVAGLHNLREATLFPRDLDRLSP